MTEKTPLETTNLDIYGHEALVWQRARDALELSKGPDVTHFLGTSRPDGTPTPPGSGRNGGTASCTSPAARTPARPVTLP